MRLTCGFSPRPVDTAAQAAEVERGVWSAPERPETAARQTLKQYADTWLASRDLKPRTRMLYRDLLDALIVPHLGDVLVERLAPTTVRNWYASLDAGTPPHRAHAYSLLRSIMTTAVADDLATANRVPHPGRGLVEAQGRDEGGESRRAGGHGGRDAGAVAPDGAARRVVWAALRGAGRAAPGRRRSRRAAAAGRAGGHLP